MAVVGLASFDDQQSNGPEGHSLNSTASYSTSTFRTGLASVRCNPASGAMGFCTPGNMQGNYAHWAMNIVTIPSVARVIAGSATSINILLNTDGTLSVRDGASVLGTSSTALGTGTWYWIGFRNQASVTGVLLQIDGVDQASGTTGASATANTIGFSGTEASAAELFIDDYVSDNAGFLAASKVAALRPISDDTVTNWTAGAGATTNLWDAVDNSPPSGLASASETNTSNVESASSTGTATYIANLTTYTTAGINSGDTVLAVRACIKHGEDIATGTKTGTYELTSNPVISSTAFTFGSDGGAHGAEAGLWVRGTGAVQASPSVTLGTSPKMKLVKTDTTTRVGCIDYMGLVVAWTPAAAAPAASFVIPHRHRGLIVR